MSITDNVLAQPHKVIEFRGLPRKLSNVEATGNWTPIWIEGLVLGRGPAGNGAVLDKWPGDPKEVSIDEISTTPGDWFGVFKDNKDRYLLISDFFGYVPVFWAVVTDGSAKTLAAGSTIQSVRALLDRKGCNRELDWATVLPHMASRHTIFQTRASTSTFDASISVLQPNQGILLSQEGYGIVDLSFNEDPQKRSYEELLTAGIKRGADQITDVLDLTDGRSQFFLSGGKDSRVMLALALASGSAERLGISTEVPSGPAGPSRDVIERDYLLATQLVQYFGLNWSRRDLVFSERCTYEEAIRAWQHHRSNNSFQIRRGQSVVSYDSQHPIAVFVGIGGELMRSYLGGGIIQSFSDWHTKTGKTADTIQDDLRALFPLICDPVGLPDDLYRLALEQFVASHSFEAHDVQNALDLGYNAYRNRAHAGTGPFHRSYGRLNVRPLAQPELIWASKMLPKEDQHDGKILFDIMEKVEPKLLAIPFASPPWPDRFVRAAEKLEEADLSEAIAKHNAALQYERNNTIRHDDRGLPLQEFAPFAWSRLKHNLSKIRECSNSEAKEILDSSLIERMIKGAEFGEEMLAVALCVSESILDVYDPLSHRTEIASINIQAPNNIFSFNNILSRPPVRDEVVERIFVTTRLDGFRHMIKGQARGGTVELCVSIEGLTPEHEVAVYWYRNGNKMEVDWYQKEKTFFKELERDTPGADKFRGQIFVRRCGSKDIIKYVSTSTVTV